MSSAAPAGSGRRIDPALLWLAAAFAASRLLLHARGVRFDASPLGWFWQYLDVPWLRTDLLRSLWVLHMQPPLFNAFLGAVLKLGGSPPFTEAVLHGFYVAVGLAIASLLHVLLRDLGVGPRISVAAALLYSLSPTAILYENWLFYTHLEAGMLLAAAWFLRRLVEHARMRSAAGFFAVLAALALMRALFHLVWLTACAALALAATRPPRLRVAAFAAAALLVVAGLYAKNAWLFDAPAASSWFGMNLANAVLQGYSDAELAQRVEAHVTSPLVEIPPFSPLASYPTEWTRDPDTEIPALGARTKHRGESNYNHLAYLELSRQYGRDALALIQHDPGRYLALLGQAWRRFLLSPSDYELVAPNRERLGLWDRAYDAVVYGVPDAWTGRPRPPPAPAFAARPAPPISLRRMGWLWLALASAAVCDASWLVARTALRQLRPGAAGADRVESARLATLAFCVFNVAFVGVVANAVEFGDNNRFRVAVEPLLVVLVAFGASRLAAWRREAATPTGSPR